MKTKLFALKKICAPLLLSACFVPALGAAETFVTNGAGIAWTGYRSNTATVFAFDDEAGTTTMTNLDAKSYVWGFLPSAVALGVGDALTLTGTATFNSVAGDSSFYFGLYDSGPHAAPTAGTTFSSIVEGTWGMTGFFAGTDRASASADASTEVFSRFAEKPATESSKGAGFMTSNQGKSYIASQTPSASTLTHPTAGTPYKFSLEIRRTESGYDVSVGGQEAVSFAADQSLRSGNFDVIAMKSPGSGITLSGFSVETTGAVVPEPSAFGLLAGTLSLLLCGARRGRRRS